MPQSPFTESRSGPRYVAAFPVRAEWDTSDGVHIVSEGETENVGPEGTLIHLQRDLPPVGSRVNLLVLGDDGEKLRVVAEVLRIERNPAHPQAAAAHRHAEDIPGAGSLLPTSSLLSPGFMSSPHLSATN